MEKKYYHNVFAYWKIGSVFWYMYLLREVVKWDVLYDVSD